MAESGSGVEPEPKAEGGTGIGEGEERGGGGGSVVRALRVRHCRRGGAGRAGQSEGVGWEAGTREVAEEYDGQAARERRWRRGAGDAAVCADSRGPFPRYSWT
jgi:hypothetical protein